MIYILNLAIGTLAFSFYEKVFYKSSQLLYFIFFIPFIVIWVLLIGGQYNVGTDYFSYLRIFSSIRGLELYQSNGEYLFFYLVRSLKELGFLGQFFFFLFAIFAVFLYLKIARKVTMKHYALFFFLFITVSTLYHNQMNGIRQCTAVYLVTLALLELSEGRTFKFFILIILACGFHISSIAISILFLFRKIHFKKKTAIILLLLAAVCSFIPVDTFIRDFILLIPQYAHYENSQYLDSISLVDKLTKLVYLPIYLFSLKIIGTGELSESEERIFQIGLLSYMLKTLCLVSTVTYRLGYFFLLISILPIFYYLRYLKKDNYFLYMLLCVGILLIYIVKVVLFPSAEYSYNSIFLYYF